MTKMIGDSLGIAWPLSQRGEARSQPTPLEVREQEGKYQVKDGNRNWITCENKSDAQVFSGIRALADEACSDANAGRNLVARLERAEELSRKYGMREMARWFGERVEHFRTLETLVW
jgi:hypothetical protein